MKLIMPITKVPPFRFSRTESKRYSQIYYNGVIIEKAGVFTHEQRCRMMDKLIEIDFKPEQLN